MARKLALISGAGERIPRIRILLRGEFILPSEKNRRLTYFEANPNRSGP
jgi:hypothetical protein